VEDVRNSCKRVGTAHTTFTKSRKMNRRTKQKLEQLKKLTKEELMILYYAQKERAVTLNTTIRERHIFEKCQTVVCRHGKAKNRFSREEAGTFGSYVTTRRFPNSRITCACKSRNLY
jgi:hypothetical protein